MNNQKAQSVNRAIKSKRILSVIALLGLVVPGVSATSSQASTLQPIINLATSANYIVLAHTAITNGATTIISGTGTKVVGISPGVSNVGTVSSILASGATQFQNGTGEPTLAQTDLQNAIASVSLLTPKVVSANLSLADNATIYPGVYTTPRRSGHVGRSESDPGCKGRRQCNLRLCGSHRI